MDIPVSQLNRRLGVQLPSELPLGLVFVVGVVADLDLLADGRLRFWLSEEEFRISCVLTVRAAAETDLAEGDEVRAGGHLAYDERLAGYVLLARDVDVVQPVADTAVPPLPKTDQAALRELLSEVSRRSQTAVTIPPEMPGWVQRLAPEGAFLEGASEGAFKGALEGGLELAAKGPEDDLSKVEVKRPSFADQFELNEEMITFLSHAMDQDEDVELNSDLLRELGVPPPAERPLYPDIGPVRPPRSTSPDLLLTMFIATMLIVAVLILMALLVIGLSG